MNKIAWKVVRQIGNTKKYTSLFTHDYSLVYDNSWITPRIGKIFVFRTRQEARHYASRYNLQRDIKVKKVLCRNLEWAPNDIAQFFIDVREFWVNRNCYMMEAPTGTMFADAVKIVE